MAVDPNSATNVWSYVLITTCIKGLWFCNNILIIAVEIRTMLGMFLQVNPYFQPYLTLWEFTDPVFNFGRYYYPQMFGFDICPWANIFFLQLLDQALDMFLFNINEMNIEALSGERWNPVTGSNRKYTLPAREVMRARTPTDEKSWLKTWSYEDIYNYRVPGAPPKPPTERFKPELDPRLDSTITPDNFGLPLNLHPVTDIIFYIGDFMYQTVMFFIHLPVTFLNILHF